VSFTDLSLIVALRRVTSTYVQFQPMNARAFASLDAQIFFYVETRTLRHRDGERSVHSYIALFDAVDQRPFIIVALFRVNVDTTSTSVNVLEREHILRIFTYVCVCVCTHAHARNARVGTFVHMYIY